MNDTGQYDEETGGFVKRGQLIDSVHQLHHHACMTDLTTPSIAALRRFNRFYTKQIGALAEGLSQSRFSLTEARVLYELAHRPNTPASTIGSALDLDASYLSRILRGFEMEGLLTRTPSEADRRQQLLTLTEAGRAAFAPLDGAACREAGRLLATLTVSEQAELLHGMGRIEALLTRQPRPWTLRPPLPGDIGWVIQRHGAVYADEYGFDARFEALVAKVAGDYLTHRDPAREHCWIAERDGVRLGSVFLMRQSDEVGKLRLLIVEPSARGLNLGKHLVATCIDAARAAGYRRLTLWTNDIMLAARGIYQKAGFRLVASTSHNNFGPWMVGEDWELDL